MPAAAPYCIVNSRRPHRSKSIYCVTQLPHARPTKRTEIADTIKPVIGPIPLPRRRTVIPSRFKPSYRTV